MSDNEAWLLAWKKKVREKGSKFGKYSFAKKKRKNSTKDYYQQLRDIATEAEEQNDGEGGGK